jgi:Fe-S-cluster containining protein
MAEAARKSGTWLGCRPGCAECCIGPFAITELDAARLREGLAELETRDPERASRVRARAVDAVQRWTRDYPGDTLARVLAEDDAAENDLCPALDPETRTCDLYASRPVTCRTFGPAVRFSEDSLAICELCYLGAAAEEIAACEVVVDPENLESRLLEELGNPGETTVAFALTS